MLLLIQHIGNDNMHIEEQIDTLQSEIDQKRQEIRSDYYSIAGTNYLNGEMALLMESIYRSIAKNINSCIMRF